MQDPLDVSLQDDELLAELELTTTLMIAATAAAQQRLGADELDRLLGVRRARPAAAPRPQRRAPEDASPGVSTTVAPDVSVCRAPGARRRVAC